MPYFDSSGWFLIEKTTILTNSCCLHVQPTFGYLRSSAFGVALRTEGWLYVLPVWKRIYTCARADAPPPPTCKTHPSWIPSHTPNFDAIRPAVCKIWKRGVHVRTCRFTPTQTCIKHLSIGSLFTHKNWTRSAQSFARSGKRGLHVRTCRCTPPQTCGKQLSNGSLFTHKIWTQFAQAFARSGKRGVHVRTCRCTPPQTCVKLLF